MDIIEKPEVLLLSNGLIQLWLIIRSGYSKKDNLTVYRWKGDSTSDVSMLFIHMDLESYKYWSPYQALQGNW